MDYSALYPSENWLLLAKTFLLPTLLYGCELYANCDSLCRGKLNILYNNIARYVYCVKRRDHISVFALKIFSIKFDDLLKVKCLMLLHKVINSHEPKYLVERIQFTRSARSLNLLSMKYSCLVSERQFFVFAVRLWNALPYKIKTIRSTSHFKNELLHNFAL